MSRLHDTQIAMIEQWSVDEAIAVYEFSTLVQDHLWRLHEYELREHLYSEDDIGDPQTDEDIAYLSNLELPFDDPDDIAF